jgi:hypothetical protein
MMTMDDDDYDDYDDYDDDDDDDEFLVEWHFITRALVCRSATANHLCEEL